MIILETMEELNRELLEINIELSMMKAEDWQIRLLLTKGMQELKKRAGIDE